MEQLSCLSGHLCGWWTVLCEHGELARSIHCWPSRPKAKIHVVGLTRDLSRFGPQLRQTRLTKLTALRISGVPQPLQLVVSFDKFRPSLAVLLKRGGSVHHWFREVWLGRGFCFFLLCEDQRHHGEAWLHRPQLWPAA
ncbi:hypothetical protein CEXT_125911 [Caerostris extrusa]|uniref:Uncharacterized protein n=1 Tax=Caerostris extrusa TaxID=172846 RepID=A0AAV4X6Y9_CAEEX|nr:hypothetical protein CEXT_125911 [Caerostris extrusa]